MRKIEHLSSVEEYYQVEKIIGTDWEFLINNRPRLIYNYIQEYLKNEKLFINELNERDSTGKFLGYEKNCAIRVVQELRSNENKDIPEIIESSSVKQFRTLDDFVSSHEIEKPRVREVEKYDSKYLAQQYLKHLNSEDEFPTFEEYEAFMKERPEEEFMMCSDEEIEARIKNTLA